MLYYYYHLSPFSACDTAKIHEKIVISRDMFQNLSGEVRISLAAPTRASLLQHVEMELKPCEQTCRVDWTFQSHKTASSILKTHLSQ